MGNSYSRIPALWELSGLRSTSRKAAFGSILTGQQEILQEESFHTMLTLERRRAERSRKPFVLMLVDANALVEKKTANRLLPRVTSVLLKSTRDTDLVGWYEKGVVLGVIFTEICPEGKNPIGEVLHAKIVNALQGELSHKAMSSLVITVHQFPENPGQDGDKPVANTRFYPDLSKGDVKNSVPQVVKRVIDVVGSAALLLILSPLVGLIAIAIKLTSKGTVIFQQERLGQFGSRFKCLKYRTMYTNNDPSIHQEYIHRLMAGQPDRRSGNSW